MILIPLLLIALIIVLIVAAALIWRWMARRRSLPCPAWLIGMMESSVMTAGPIGTDSTLDRLGLKPGQRVLEIGPGPGRLLLPAAQRVLPGGSVTGLDIQPRMIERLKQRAEQAGIENLSTVVGDAAQPHFPPESFDVVYLCTVLGEIPQREQALAQCHAVLKPGGLLSITEIFGDPHYQSRSTVSKLAEGAGFKLQALHGQWWFYTANFVKDTPTAE